MKSKRVSQCKWNKVFYGPDPFSRIRDRFDQILWPDWWIFISGQSGLRIRFWFVLIDLGLCLSNEYPWSCISAIIIRCQEHRMSFVFVAANRQLISGGPAGALSPIDESYGCPLVIQWRQNREANRLTDGVRFFNSERNRQRNKLLSSCLSFGIFLI
jgi:hypothetical protein